MHLNTKIETTISLRFITMLHELCLAKTNAWTLACAVSTKIFLMGISYPVCMIHTRVSNMQILTDSCFLHQDRRQNETLLKSKLSVDCSPHEMLNDIYSLLLFRSSYWPFYRYSMTVYILTTFHMFNQQISLTVIEFLCKDRVLQIILINIMIFNY